MALTFGLLGTGYWAAETHGAALHAHPGAELAGVWGRDAAKAAALAERYGARPYGEVDALLADVDAVAVALPPDVQGELALRAARAGCHLLLDKPVAFAPDVAAEIAAEARRRELAGLVFFTSRFVPDIENALTWLAASGGVTGADATLLSSIYGPGSPYAGSTWRQEKGGLWDLGPHALSVVVPVLGAVAEVAAMQGLRQTAHLLTRHEGGAVATLALTQDAHPAARRWQVTFNGEHGWTELPGLGDPVAAFTAAVTRLVTAAEHGAEEQACGLDLGRDVVAVLAAAETSLTRGSAVRVDEVAQG